MTNARKNFKEMPELIPLSIIHNCFSGCLWRYEWSLDCSTEELYVLRIILACIFGDVVNSPVPFFNSHKPMIWFAIRLRVFSISTGKFGHCSPLTWLWFSISHMCGEVLHQITEQQLGH